MPFSKLFRSRWSALLWAAGILWTALDVAGGPSAPEPAANAAAAADLAAATNDQNMRLFVNMMDGH